MRLSALLVAALLCAPPVWAADAARIDATLIISSDTGRTPNQAVWRTIPTVGGFVQREPHEGAEPSQATEFSVAFDDTMLYVNVHAYDREPDKIVTYLTRRDDDSPCDWIRIFIDSYHDRKTAYEFAVNPDGVKQDRYWFNDTNNDKSWDAVWDVTVARDQSGWSAQFRIPFSQLRFTKAAANTFGFAVAREISRLKETTTWPLLARSAPGYVSSFGEVAGLSTTAASKRLEVTPYAVANLTRQPTGGNPLLSASAPGGELGVDVKYALTPGLTLTATVNPDFGQVEADPAVVNLSAFETFFSEQRPFFVEGSGNFRFDADCYDGCNNLFYSRRIGRAPQAIVNLPYGDAIYTDSPAQTAILGAAKVTGRVGRYAIGVMNAVTRDEFARVLIGSTPSRQAVEPASNYLVSRVRREFANQSYVGFMATAVNRGQNDAANILPESAYVGGMDFDWRFRKRYSVNGFWEASRVSGHASAIENVQKSSRHNFQRPDLTSTQLDPTRTSLAGGAGAISVSKIGGEYVRFNSNFYFRSPGFETNDLGFLRRADQRQMSNWIQFRNDRPSRWFRNRAINFNQWAGWNFDGDRLGSGGNVNGNVTFINNWQAGGGFGPQLAGLDDRVARGGPGVRTNTNREQWFWFYSDNRRRVSAGLEGDVGGDGQGSSWQQFDPSVTVRPTPAIMFSVGPRINRNVADAQWVTNLTGEPTHYVFAHLDQTTVSMTARFNYTMTPNLSLQLYAQPFVSAGEYNAFKEIADPRNPDYNLRYAPFDYAYDAYGNPDFNVKSFRTTNVLRWEYKPGSTLFVVWQQARSNYAVPGGFEIGRDARAIFGVPPHNVFLVKISYWLNY